MHSDFLWIVFAEEEYKAEIPPITFFEEVNRNRTPGSAGHGISPIGFVPNSVLVKILYPPPSPPPDPATLRPYRPPQLTAKQLSEIKALKKVGSVCVLNSVVSVSNSVVSVF